MVINMYTCAPLLSCHLHVDQGCIHRGGKGPWPYHFFRGQFYKITKFCIIIKYVLQMLQANIAYMIFFVGNIYVFTIYEVNPRGPLGPIFLAKFRGCMGDTWKRQATIISLNPLPRVDLSIFVSNTFVKFYD